MRHYDLIVIGTAPVGQKSAIQGSKLAERVAIVEKADVLGGAQINPAPSFQRPCAKPCCTSRG